MDKFEKEIQGLLEKQRLKEPLIEIPPNPELGDYAVPCFKYAKELGKSPGMIAEETAKKISSKLFERIAATGPYINFFVSPSKFAEEALKIEKKRWDKKKKMMMEFSSPNTNKPLHLGHLRNIFLGESLSRIYEYGGHEVIRACLVNDRGIHICKSMLAYMKWGKGRTPDKKGDHFVGGWYVKFSEGAKKNPVLEDEAQELLRRWESGDKSIVKLWERMKRWVLEGFGQTYKKLGIRFDKTYYESEIYDKAKNMVRQGLKEGKLKKDGKGNIIAPLSEHGFNEDKVVLRSDGTTVYITQDIYLARKKFEDFRLDMSFYVVGSEQNLHFQQLFKIIELLGIAKKGSMRHIS